MTDHTLQLRVKPPIFTFSRIPTQAEIEPDLLAYTSRLCAALGVEGKITFEMAIEAFDNPFANYELSIDGRKASRGLSTWTAGKLDSYTGALMKTVYNNRILLLPDDVSDTARKLIEFGYRPSRQRDDLPFESIIAEPGISHLIVRTASDDAVYQDQLRTMVNAARTSLQTTMAVLIPQIEIQVEAAIPTDRIELTINDLPLPPMTPDQAAITDVIRENAASFLTIPTVRYLVQTATQDKPLLYQRVQHRFGDDPIPALIDKFRILLETNTAVFDVEKTLDRWVFGGD